MAPLNNLIFEFNRNLQIAIAFVRLLNESLTIIGRIEYSRIGLIDSHNSLTTLLNRINLIKLTSHKNGNNKKFYKPEKDQVDELQRQSQYFVLKTHHHHHASVLNQIYDSTRAFSSHALEQLRQV